MCESCFSSFISIMGYFYYVRKCGKGVVELEKMILKCYYCGKLYRLKVGFVYYLRLEYGFIFFFLELG